jgi:hypothetical protein
MSGGHTRREHLKVTSGAPLGQASVLLTNLRLSQKGYPGKDVVNYLASPAVIKNVL